MVAELIPERQREIEAGFDATLLGGRATLEVTGYQKRITDLLLAQSLAQSTGFSSTILNGGVMRTTALSTMSVVIRSMQFGAKSQLVL